MTKELTENIKHVDEKNRIIFYIIFFLGILLLLFGIVSTAGSLMAEKLSGYELGDPFDIIFYPIILYLCPSLLISYALTKLKTSFRLSVISICAITLFGFIFCFIGEFSKTNNYLVRSDENINKALNNVEIMYQKRFNLIRNLDISVKNYEVHEQTIIKEITDARKQAIHSSNTEGKLSALSNFDASIRNLIINFENYPNLKADQIVLELIKEIKIDERELLSLKTEYNSKVTKYNTTIRLMPYMITARLLNFDSRKFIDKEFTSEIYDATKLLSKTE